MEQKELAEITGITKNSINASYHERSQGIRFDILNAICRTLGCQPGELLEYVPDAPEGQRGGVSALQEVNHPPKKKRGLFGF